MRQVAFAGVLLAASAFGAEAETGIEVLHWWISPGETAAVSEIRSAFEASGGKWIDRPLPTFDAVRKASIEEFAAGYAPAAMQWRPGDDLGDMAEYELVAPTEPIAQEDGWRESMYPIVQTLAGRDGAFVAAPISIHGENWVWYSRSVYDAVGLEIPSTWEELLAQAPLIRAAGFTPLAVSDQEWQLRILFSSILLGVAGQEIYQMALLDKKTDALRMPETRAALDIFLRMRGLADPGQADRSWSEATAMVARGEAAAQFMGDWAKGEFLALGLKADEDYVCRLAPQSEASFVVGVDLFLFGRSEDPEVAAAQKLLARTVVSPEVQIAFARQKGSVPIRRDLGDAVRRLDSCAERAIAVLERREGVLPTIDYVDDGVYLARLDAALKAIWTTPTIEVDQAIDLLADSMTGDR